MNAESYFSRLAHLMKDNPPAAVDAAMVKTLTFLGLQPGQPFDFRRLDADAARGLQATMGAFDKLQRGVKDLKTYDGWIVMPGNMGDYGTDYTTRAGIALVGLGAIQPQDVVYPTAFLDGDGKVLDGGNRYVLHFGKGRTPPANATWSVSMYDPQGFYVPNILNRYNLAAWMPLKYNGDGSLDLYVQANSPGPDTETNWLPAPPGGAFNLTVRDYWPTEAILNGSYKLPPIRPVP